MSFSEETPVSTRKLYMLVTTTPSFTVGTPVLSHRDYGPRIPSSLMEMEVEVSPT